MYFKCNYMFYVLYVFEIFENVCNVYVYNVIIFGFVGNSLYEQGFMIYLYMRCEGVILDKFIFFCVIKGCLEVLEVKKIYGLLFKFGLELDVFIGSVLVNCFLKFRVMDDVYYVFDELFVRDVVFWNVMINGYVYIGEFKMVLEVFRRMSEDLVLFNNFTVIGVLLVLVMSVDVDNGNAIYGFVIKKGYGFVVVVLNVLIDMYGKCKCMSKVVQVFELMREKDIFLWNTVMGVYEQFGDYYGTIDFFRRMLDLGVRFDFVIVIILFLVCFYLIVLMYVKEIYRYMILYGLWSNGDMKDLDYLFVNNVFMDIYVKFGNMKYVYRVFDLMSIRDVVLWNIMIMGYGMYGYGNEVLYMFDCMCVEYIEFDEVIFVGVLLVCSYVGFVYRGREYLSKMDFVYGLVSVIEYYVCVIDMFGRVGQFDEVYELILIMFVESNVVVWRVFLVLCRFYGNVYFVEFVGKYIFEFEFEYCGNYILMFNIYGVSGWYEEVLDVRLIMRG